LSTDYPSPVDDRRLQCGIGIMLLLTSNFVICFRWLTLRGSVSYYFITLTYCLEAWRDLLHSNMHQIGK